MAKRSYRKTSKIQPAVQTMTFTGLTVPGGAGSSGTFYIDLSQCASLANRRFYRQGINWAAAGFKFLTSSGATAIVQVAKLPNTWVMSNAWEKSFRSWQKMNAEAYAESESVRPRFQDFKVYADQGHHTAGYGANLLPFAHIAGEWESSKLVIPDTAQGATGGINNYEFIAVGPNYPGAGASGLNAVSLIDGYAASRGLPNRVDPNIPGDAMDADGATPENWMSALFNEGTQQTDEVLNDATENNEAPYPYENDGTHGDTMYPGGANQAAILQLHDQEYITATTIGGTTRLKGGNFPCGLIKIQIVNLGSESIDSTLQLDLVPGNHRGYLCEPMTEM